MTDFTFTPEQIAHLDNAGYDSDLIEALENQPAFLQHMGVIEDACELSAILQGGCASGAYMPAVTYHTALQCLTACSESLEDQLERYADSTGELALVWDVANETLSGFAVKVCSIAVETWCYQFEELIEELNSEGLIL